MSTAESRLERLRHKMREAELDGFVSFHPPSNEYLTGFRGTTSGVLVTPKEALFLCDFRYTEQAREQVRGYQVEQVDGPLEPALAERIEQLGRRKAGYDSSTLSVAQLHTLEKRYNARLIPSPDVISSLRVVKDAGEITRIRAASELAEGVMLEVLDGLQAGVSEREVAAELEYRFQQRGASGASFPPIVLFGARSSLPHGMPGDRTLQEGDVVLVDLGCVRDSYCSDLTRTCVFGTIPGPWFEQIYSLTLRAQHAALDALRPGVSCRELDEVARAIIRDAGHGGHFGHGLGHGVGLEIHEAPRLNKHSDAVLETGMVVTVEPGVYLPERGGVRIEDLVVITEDGCDILTQSPKELRVLPA